MSGFLSVPTKKTSEVDFSKPLTKYISANFRENAANNEAISDFARLRNNAVVKPVDKLDVSLSVTIRYYDQLTAIVNKLPLTGTQISIAFKWKNAFDKGSLLGKSRGLQTLMINSGQFERSCVLFNVGSLLSQLAASQSLGTDEELQNAAKWLQQSAGIFAALEQSVSSSVQQESTPDLLPDTLHTLTAITLAQAQEAIYLKAARDKMKPGLISKIAVQTGILYEDVLKQMNDEKSKVLWDKEWQQNVKVKIRAFQVLAQLHQSCVNKENKEIGEELSRLKECQSMMKEVKSQMLGQVLRLQVEKIDKAFESADKDNNFIYHERIPDFATLPALSSTPTVVKTTPLNSPMGTNFQDLFANLESKDTSGLLSKVKKAFFGQ